MTGRDFLPSPSFQRLNRGRLHRDGYFSRCFLQFLVSVSQTRINGIHSGCAAFIAEGRCVFTWVSSWIGVCCCLVLAVNAKLSCWLSVATWWTHHGSGWFWSKSCLKISAISFSGICGHFSNPFLSFQFWSGFLAFRARVCIEGRSKGRNDRKKHLLSWVVGVRTTYFYGIDQLIHFDPMSLD